MKANQEMSRIGDVVECGRSSCAGWRGQRLRSAAAAACLGFTRNERKTLFGNREKGHAQYRRICSVAAALILLAHLAAYGASTVVSTSFRETTASGWVLGGTGLATNGGVTWTNTGLLTAAAGIDSPGNGWLRLTSTNTYLSGYALNAVGHWERCKFDE